MSSPASRVGEGCGGGEVPGGTGWSPGTPRLPRGAGSRREERGPARRARAGSRRAEESWRAKTRRGSRGQRPRACSGAKVPCQLASRRVPRSPPPSLQPPAGCPQAPRVTEALADGSGSRRRRPAASGSRDSPRPSTSSARECGWSGRGGSPGSAADAPPFPRRRTARK